MSTWYIARATMHKYIDRVPTKGGGWRYIYEEPSSKGLMGQRKADAHDRGVNDPYKSGKFVAKNDNELGKMVEKSPKVLQKTMNTMQKRGKVILKTTRDNWSDTAHKDDVDYDEVRDWQREHRLGERQDRSIKGTAYSAEKNRRRRSRR